MQQSSSTGKFEVRTAEYFRQKAKEAKGTGKMVVALEMSKYLTAAREYGLSFEELKRPSFKFTTV